MAYEISTIGRLERLKDYFVDAATGLDVKNKGGSSGGVDPRGGCSPPLFSRRETTNDKRERCQDEIASDILHMRKYVGSNFSGMV